MELIVLTLLALGLLASLAVRHRLQVVAWDRELETAFGSGALRREISSHRRL